MTERGNDTRAIRLGVVGAGRIAQAAHLPAIAKASGVALVAISDPSPTLAHGVASRYEVEPFTETEKLLEHDLDAVLIATPDRFHHPLGMLALQAGKHVLMEKPLAATSEQARELAEVASSRGLKLQTGAMRRHDPGLVFARAQVPRIGRILSINSWYRVMSSLRPPTEATLFPALVVDQEVRQVESAFKVDRERYQLATQGAHVFDGLEAFGGPGAWVSARVGRIGSDFTWHGVAGMANSEGLISFEITTDVHGEWAEGMEIHGELGHIVTRTRFPFFRHASEVEVHIEGEGVSIMPHFGDTNPFKLQVESFARAILDDTPTDPTPEAGVRAVRWIEAVAESTARGGEEVRLD
jgi:predicted dehydrogenase